jgi:hypothetical protein
MSNQRRLRRAKKARRAAVQAKTHMTETTDNGAFSDILERAVRRRHPFHLLSLAGVIISVADTKNLDRFLTGLIDERSRGTTALLAVLAELLIDDPALQLRCREALADRNDQVARWTDLRESTVYRVLRRTHVLGDVDELFLGVRLSGQHEVSLGILFDHNTFSSIADAAVWSNPLSAMHSRLAEGSGDANVIDMDLADARAWIEHALTKPTFGRETDTWPQYRPLLRWLAARLPDGGEYRLPTTDWRQAVEVCDGFFASVSAAPFTASSHRDLLLELFETGTGDPLRWSATRVEDLLGGLPHYDEYIALDVALDAPDLLRAFIPYAHAQSGICDELTSRALVAIDELRSEYKRELLRQAARWGFEDAI